MPVHYVMYHAQGIGVADGLAGMTFTGPIISADAARDYTVLQFCSILCGLGCVIVVTTHCVPLLTRK